MFILAIALFSSHNCRLRMGQLVSQLGLFAHQVQQLGYLGRIYPAVPLPIEHMHIGHHPFG